MTLLRTGLLHTPCQNQFYTHYEALYANVPCPNRPSKKARTQDSTARRSPTAHAIAIKRSSASGGSQKPMASGTGRGGNIYAHDLCATRMRGLCFPGENAILRMLPSLPCDHSPRAAGAAGHCANGGVEKWLQRVQSAPTSNQDFKHPSQYL